jgi:SPP1 gp7 family putative phage head morphogenesis protein
MTLGAVIGKPPREALEYFKAKGLVLTGDWRELWKEQHAKAFTVANLTKMDVLQLIYDTLTEAQAEGITAYTFEKVLAPVLQKKGWWGQAIDPATGEIIQAYPGTSRPVEWGSPRRLKLIYRQNMQTAYMIGRYKHQRALADFKGPGARPYWMYVAVMDQRTRPGHAALDGKVFHADDPFWNHIYPPNGWNCRCRVRALTQKQVDEMGIEVKPAELETMDIAAGRNEDGSAQIVPVTGVKYKDPVTGQTKVMLPDAGWDYNPGKAAAQAEQLKELEQQKAQQLPKL